MGDVSEGPDPYSHTIHVCYICLHLVDVIVNVGKYTIHGLTG